MNFSNYTKQKVKKEDKKQPVNDENIKNQFDMYSKMDSNQLMKELFSTVNNQKQKGTFNFEAISGALESIKGQISKENYENIKNLLDSLK